jgi:hypothetical protein
MHTYRRRDRWNLLGACGNNLRGLPNMTCNDVDTHAHRSRNIAVARHAYVYTVLRSGYVMQAALADARRECGTTFRLAS